MNQEVKKLWIEALRSRKYKQGKYCLSQIDTETGEESHCCLGVLCKISPFTYTGGDLGLPRNIQDWADLGSWLPSIDLSMEEKNKLTNFSGGPLPVQLSHLNDSEDYTFEQIAYLIEKYL